ncbi:SAM-dependent methyltransferase [Nakamurella sp. UYEF19]|uniref:class I SAM-dependent methyltransferase n=1 Tax=Nakamurella sp. UYEF19 TaxID=1756392 RepID=UPI00339AEBBB
MFDYDAELRRYHAHLMEAVDIGSDAQVLDIGCGTGQTTRAAARVALDGHALGIDISAPMLAQARRLTGQSGLANVKFERGDAQIHSLPRQHFTVGISRFGTMFFTDPTAAFAHIAHAMRPGATFIQLVWQDSSRQEWHVAIRRALSPDGPVSSATSTASVAFSMPDPAEVGAILTGAGFVDVRVSPVDEPVYYGADGEGALRAIQSLGMTERILRDLDTISAARGLGRLQRLLDVRNQDGVWFESSAWLVSARRP